MSQRTGTTGTAPFVIQDDAIPQPAAYADQLNKGWHTRNTITDRNAMPLHYRGWGMVCVITNDDSNNGVYQLTRPSAGIADDDEGALMDNGNWMVWGGDKGIQTFRITNYVFSVEQYAQAQVGDLIFNANSNNGYLSEIDKVVPPGKNWQVWFGSDYHTPMRVESMPADDTGDENDIAVIVYNNINNDNLWLKYCIKNTNGWQEYLNIICDTSPFITGVPTSSTNPVFFVSSCNCYMAIDDNTYIPYIFSLSTEWVASVSIAPDVDAGPIDNSPNAVQSGGVKLYVDNVGANITGRVFNAEPTGGWKAGDIWLYTDAAGNLLEVSKITSSIYGWMPYQAPVPQGGFTAFAPLYNIVVPHDANGVEGGYWWMGAYPPNGIYGPKNGNIWLEYFKKINGHWVSQLQIISNVSPYDYGHTTPADGVIVNTGERIAMYSPDGGIHVVKYTAVPYTVLAKSNQVTSLSANPTINDIASDTFTAIKNSTTGSISLWVNDSGTLKSIAFS